MMLKKRMRVFGGAVAICTMMSVMTVPAVTKGFNFHFKSTQGAVTTESGPKNDDEQKYYLTINSGNVSKENVFGARIRLASNNVAKSSYVLHYNKKKSVGYKYSDKVYKGTNYYLKGKKDTCSTSGVTLDVAGRVTY